MPDYSCPILLAQLLPYYVARSFTSLECKEESNCHYYNTDKYHLSSEITQISSQIQGKFIFDIHIIDIIDRLKRITHYVR